MPKLCTYIGFVVCLVVFLSEQSLARFWRHMLPTNSSATYYKKFQKVPSIRVTAKKFGTNFLRIRPSFSRITKRQTIEEDIVVVIDGSGSVTRCEFDKGKKALKNMMGEANVGQPANTRYAAVTFCNSASVNFNFLPYSLAANRITLIPYPDGMTNTQAGLVEAKKLFDDPQHSGRRINARKIVLLITDGQSNVKKSLTIPNAWELKKSGVQIFVVAVGNSITGIDEMVKVSSSPPESFMFRVDKLASFWKVVNLALNQVSPGKYTIADGHFTAPCHYS